MLRIILQKLVRLIKITFISFIVGLNTCNNAEKVNRDFDNNLFAASEVKINDRIAGYRITSLRVTQGNADYSAEISFSGETELAGRYRYYQDGPVLGSNICFYVDQSDQNKLPRLIDDHRFTWFCFKNREQAGRYFGPPGTEGIRKVKIRDYRINYAPAQVWNTAELAENTGK